MTDGIHRELGAAIKVHSVQDNLPISTRMEGYANVPIDGHREDIPFIIVRVLADEVHSPRGADDGRRAASKMLAKYLIYTAHEALPRPRRSA
jgi:hypothetical protein